MQFDDSSLLALLEESKDLHADTMRIMPAKIDETIELAKQDREQRSIDSSQATGFASSRARDLVGGGFGIGVLGALGMGAALAAVVSSPAFASSATDVQILQTAASIEVLAVATYGVALTLPFIGGSAANPTVAAFAKTTMSQHQQHLAAFNAAVTGLGGVAQTNPDPVLLQVVNNAKPSLTTPLAVVNLALELEQGAAETYVKDCSLLSSSATSARATTASIMGVEAQHAAILRAVAALLGANAPQLIGLSPTIVTQLPAAAGSIGFPDSFFPTDQARPATEGAK